LIFGNLPVAFYRKSVEPALIPETASYRYGTMAQPIDHGSNKFHVIKQNTMGFKQHRLVVIQGERADSSEPQIQICLENGESAHQGLCTADGDDTRAFECLNIEIKLLPSCR
jgi:hypothetical protein